MYTSAIATLLLPLASVGADAHAALTQAWPPFVLVAGLLLIGLVAGEEGLFDAAASKLVRVPGPPVALLVACLALVAAVTALLNLDTAAVFLTPVLVKVARRRGVEPAPFLYGSVFMANASSLFLPGSNLTNLLVLSGRHLSGAAFLARLAPYAIAAPLLTALGLVALHRGALRAGGAADTDAVLSLPRGLGMWGALLSACLIVVLPDAALPVLLVGLVLVLARTCTGRMRRRAVSSRLGAPVLVSLFALSVALGTLARASSFPADALHSAASVPTAAVAALACVLVNNLPAAVLLSSGGHVHTEALLLGLNVGPNLAVSGSLAVVLWWRAARAEGAAPSMIEYSRQGVPLAVMAIAGALALGAI